MQIGWRGWEQLAQKQWYTRSFQDALKMASQKSACHLQKSANEKNFPFMLLGWKVTRDLNTATWGMTLSARAAVCQNALQEDAGDWYFSNCATSHVCCCELRGKWHLRTCYFWASKKMREGARAACGFLTGNTKKLLRMFRCFRLRDVVGNDLKNVQLNKQDYLKYLCSVECEQVMFCSDGSTLQFWVVLGSTE